MNYYLQFRLIYLKQFLINLKIAFKNNIPITLFLKFLPKSQHRVSFTLFYFYLINYHPLNEKSCDHKYAYLKILHRIFFQLFRKNYYINEEFPNYY